MTYYKCPNCAGESYSEEYLVMKICPCCQIEMKLDPTIKKRQVEVAGDGYRSESETD